LLIARAVGTIAAVIGGLFIAALTHDLARSLEWVQPK